MASVSKVKQQLMNRLAGTATDPLAQKKSEQVRGAQLQATACPAALCTPHTKRPRALYCAAVQGGAGKASTYLADSAKAWAGVGGGGGGGSPAPLEVKIKPGEQSFGYEELKGERSGALRNDACRTVPHGVLRMCVC